MKFRFGPKVSGLFLAALLLAQWGGSACSPSNSIAPAITGSDYGDAPDQLSSKYLSGVMAAFPSRLSQQGAHHLDLNDSAFGPFKADGSLSVSAENDATDATDTDGRQNIGQPAGDSDQDGYDDGLLTTTFAPGVNNQVDFLVSVAPGAPKETRYVNMLADWNQDGTWSNASGQTEWIVQNMPIDLTP